ncbi:UPF0149 family protein [Aerosticca soli]|uniref:YecA family protein n=1 Tax=Aerosticca soli TaxID=2010829 RepID=A0A2Z6E853_9GAMM|nr:UPF0149 family protein [Aerosticca soli]BBD80901.1 hypothetical protein ALSL_2275 [Aerosticca soli]
MPSFAEPVDYETLEAALRRLRVGVDASEFHGLLSGYIAGGGVPGRQPLLATLELAPEAQAKPAPADEALLTRLAGEVERELADSDLGFQPLLPADDRPLDERAEALVAWCRGFLGGFGLAGAKAHAGLDDEAREILRDLGAIAAAELDFGEAGEDEDALIEITEFVRMAALLLFAECHAAARQGSKTLH